jgi:hypothetical protein
MAARGRGGGDVRCAGDPEHRHPPTEGAAAARGVLDREISILHGTEEFDDLTVLDRLVLVERHGERIADTRAPIAPLVHCPDEFAPQAPKVRKARR